MQDAHAAMNTTVTRVQLFAVVSFCAIMLLLVLVLRSLERRHESPLMPSVAHGIETSWPSNIGGERVWSLTGPGDFRPWLAEHIEAVKEAQRVLPIKEK